MVAVSLKKKNKKRKKKKKKKEHSKIKERKYPQSLEQYTGNILLVGINYDKKTKEHSCVIENDKKQ